MYNVPRPCALPYSSRASNTFAICYKLLVDGKRKNECLSVLLTTSLNIYCRTFTGVVHSLALPRQTHSLHIVLFILSSLYNGFLIRDSWNLQVTKASVDTFGDISTEFTCCLPRCEV